MNELIGFELTSFAAMIHSPFLTTIIKQYPLNIFTFTFWTTLSSHLKRHLFIKAVKKAPLNQSLLNAA